MPLDGSGVISVRALGFLVFGLFCHLPAALKEFWMAFKARSSHFWTNLIPQAVELASKITLFPTASRTWAGMALSVGVVAFQLALCT